MQKSKSSSPPSAGAPNIRWTVNEAAAELSTKPVLLRVRFTKYGIAPGQDGKYSTKDILIGYIGNKELATIRNIELDGDRKELLLRKESAKTIPVGMVQRAWEFAIAEVRSAIVGLGLSAKDREAVFEVLNAIPLKEYKDAPTTEEED